MHTIELYIYIYIYISRSCEHVRFPFAVGRSDCARITSGPTPHPLMAVCHARSSLFRLDKMSPSLPFPTVRFCMERQLGYLLALCVAQDYTPCYGTWYVCSISLRRHNAIRIPVYLLFYPPAPSPRGATRQLPASFLLPIYIYIFFF